MNDKVKKTATHVAVTSAQIIAVVFLGLEPRLVNRPPSDTVHAAYYKDMKKKIMRALRVCRHVRLSRCPHHNTEYRPACRLFFGGG